MNPSEQPSSQIIKSDAISQNPKTRIIAKASPPLSSLPRARLKELVTPKPRIQQETIAMGIRATGLCRV